MYPPSHLSVPKIAILGNHLPRQCGIATFTSDLSDALIAQFPEAGCFVLAMNDADQRYTYPERVRFEIAEHDISSYRHAADFLNVNDIDVVCVQHEYGIFGGKAGSHVLALLRELRMPIVTTLHTILPEPNSLQRVVMQEVLQISERVVVMTELAARTLHEVYGVARDKIDVIPHGIPFVPFECQSKDRLGVDGKSVILTFGLLSPDKGIEYVIDALPTILEKYPDTVYIVLGATHPHIKQYQGEMYRLMLENRAKRLNVDSHVIFHNRFVPQTELIEFLSATDIYITPYLNPEQATSGTLAYAVGSGRAVISTPYAHATELLADGRGIVVPWRDSSAIAREVCGLLTDTTKQAAMRACAAAYGQTMLWPRVAASYMQSFQRAQKDRAERYRSAFRAKTLAERPIELPDLNLDHLKLMTDDTGILQHAAFTVPRYEDGYCLDDNARALLLMTRLEEEGMVDTQETRALTSRYFAFVHHAFDAAHGRFRNFMAYSRQWSEAQGSEDSHGRALWALGTVVGRSGDPGRQRLSNNLFHAALIAVHDFSSPRAWAFTILGIDEYFQVFEEDVGAQSMMKQLAERLFDLFERTHQAKWPWFEDAVTYCNAQLSQALIVSGARMDNDAMLERGLHSLEWLVSIHNSEDGYFVPIGSNGFYPRGGNIAPFDEQPVEAHAMVAACFEAFRATGDRHWVDCAYRAFYWLLGHNHLHQSLYDPLTGGCRDGLHEDRVNQNQGAESTLSFLLALSEMRSADAMIALRANTALRSAP